MLSKGKIIFWGLFLSLYISPLSFASDRSEKCKNDCNVNIAFVELRSIDLQSEDSKSLIIKGKLKIPSCVIANENCIKSKHRFPAVVILHGSSGIDFRGDFYARELNVKGIATLEIDMWEARGVEKPTDRPYLPIVNYPDAFAALEFLSKHPQIDENSIGVMGFSWGAVVTMASATSQYSSVFGNGLKFSAHVANYPVCWAYNSMIPGSEFNSLTGAPVLIQIGEKDDYDDGPETCHLLKESLLLNDPSNYDAVQVVVYEGAYHAWDRLQVPITVNDPFSHRGRGGNVKLMPNVEQAYVSRNNVVSFFKRHLK